MRFAPLTLLLSRVNAAGTVFPQPNTTPVMTSMSSSSTTVALVFMVDLPPLLSRHFTEDYITSNAPRPRQPPCARQAAAAG
ncbi:MAG: hypothetical protein KJ907_07060 [Actinobacteria bacterium]|nr:hypothetical protein [Actinomycetota bacterium]